MKREELNVFLIPLLYLLLSKANMTSNAEFQQLILFRWERIPKVYLENARTQYRLLYETIEILHVHAIVTIHAIVVMVNFSIMEMGSTPLIGSISCSILSIHRYTTTDQRSIDICTLPWGGDQCYMDSQCYNGLCIGGQCVCYYNWACGDCSLGLNEDILRGATCGQYVSGRGKCTKDTDCNHISSHIVLAK